MRFVDRFGFRGEIKVECFDRDGKLISRHEDKNFIVDLGKETVIDILSGTAAATSQIFRMSLGDSGTLSGQPFVPKTADATWPSRTGIFHEVYRKPIGTITQPTAQSMKFQTSFASADVDISSFSTSPYYVNEAALVISPTSVTGDEEINKTPPDTPAADQYMFSMRTFKSQPFDPADTLTLAITWTIFIQ